MGIIIPSIQTLTTIIWFGFIIQRNDPNSYVKKSRYMSNSFNDVKPSFFLSRTELIHAVTIDISSMQSVSHDISCDLAVYYKQS